MVGRGGGARARAAAAGKLGPGEGRAQGEAAEEEAAVQGRDAQGRSGCRGRWRRRAGFDGERAVESRTGKGESCRVGPGCCEVELTYLFSACCLAHSLLYFGRCIVYSYLAER